DHGRIGRVRLGEAGHEVRRARTVLPGEEDARAARGARVAVGHVHAGALVAHADEPHLLRVVQRIEDLHARRADEAEGVLRALGFEGVHDGLAAAHACHAFPFLDAALGTKAVRENSEELLRSMRTSSWYRGLASEAADRF